MKTRPAITTMMTFALGLGTLAGCSDPRAAGPTQTRVDRINRHVVRMREREDEGPARLAVSAELIQRQARWHDAHLRRDLTRLRTWHQRDRQRWHDRQPRYRADLEDFWDGNLELADEIIPRMFY